MSLIIANKKFNSRLFLGTGKFASSKIMLDALKESGTQLVTLAMKRIDLDHRNDNILQPLLSLNNIKLLPNTSGAKTAEEAIYAAHIARNAIETSWIKLEIHPDMKYLMPDPIETLKAAEHLVKQNFVVLPYCGADPVLCKRLEEVGCAAVMPLGSPIGSNQGLRTFDLLSIIIEQSKIPVIIDAGLGAPSHACTALEIGADGVMVNTAIAIAQDPCLMAKAFRLSVEAGFLAIKSGISCFQKHAIPSSPLTDFNF